MSGFEVRMAGAERTLMLALTRVLALEQYLRQLEQQLAETRSNAG